MVERADASAVVLIALLAVTNCGGARFELSPPSLVTSQPVVHRLVSWDGGVVAFTERGGAAFFASSDVARFDEVHIDGCDEILDVSTARETALILCRSGDSLRVVRRNREVPHVVTAVPLAVDRFKARTAVSADTIAVATSRAIAIHSENAGWRTLDFAPRSELAVTVPPQHLLVGQGYLWLGYDHGEFGGGLYRVGITAEGSLPSPEPIHEISVLGIEYGNENEIWIGGNSLALGKRRGMLLRADSGRVSHIEPNWPASTEIKSFSAFTVSMDHLPVVIDAANGIYEIRGDEPIALMEGSLAIRHEVTKVRADGSPVQVLDLYHPTDVVALPDGRFLVATNGLGILELSSRDEGGSVRQLVLR